VNVSTENLLIEQQLKYSEKQVFRLQLIQNAGWLITLRHCTIWLKSVNVNVISQSYWNTRWFYYRKHFLKFNFYVHLTAAIHQYKHNLEMTVSYSYSVQYIIWLACLRCGCDERPVFVLRLCFCDFSHKKKTAAMIIVYSLIVLCNVNTIPLWSSVTTFCATPLTYFQVWQTKCQILWNVCVILLNDFVFADFILIALSSQQGGVILH